MFSLGSQKLNYTMDVSGRMPTSKGEHYIKYTFTLNIVSS